MTGSLLSPLSLPDLLTVMEPVSRASSAFPAWIFSTYWLARGFSNRLWGKLKKKNLLHTLILSKNTFLLIHCKKKKTLRIATSGLAGQTRNNEIHNVISSLVLILLMVGWQAREDLQDSDKGWIMMGKWTGNFPTYTANIWTFSYETVNLQS